MTHYSKPCPPIDICFELGSLCWDKFLPNLLVWERWLQAWPLRLLLADLSPWACRGSENSFSTSSLPSLHTASNLTSQLSPLLSWGQLPLVLPRLAGGWERQLGGLPELSAETAEWRSHTDRSQSGRPSASCPVNEQLNGSVFIHGVLSIEWWDSCYIPHSLSGVSPGFQPQLEGHPRRSNTENGPWLIARTPPYYSQLIIHGYSYK